MNSYTGSFPPSPPGPPLSPLSLFLNHHPDNQHPIVIIVVLNVFTKHRQKTPFFFYHLILTQELEKRKEINLFDPHSQFVNHGVDNKHSTL